MMGWGGKFKRQRGERRLSPDLCGGTVVEIETKRLTPTGCSLHSPRAADVLFVRLTGFPHYVVRLDFIVDVILRGAKPIVGLNCGCVLLMHVGPVEEEVGVDDFFEGGFEGGDLLSKDWGLPQAMPAMPHAS